MTHIFDLEILSRRALNFDFKISNKKIVKITDTYKYSYRKFFHARSIAKNCIVLAKINYISWHSCQTVIASNSINKALKINAKT